MQMGGMGVWGGRRPGCTVVATNSQVEVVRRKCCVPVLTIGQVDMMRRERSAPCVCAYSSRRGRRAHINEAAGTRKGSTVETTGNLGPGCISR